MLKISKNIYNGPVWIHKLFFSHPQIASNSPKEVK